MHAQPVPSPRCTSRRPRQQQQPQHAAPYTAAFTISPGHSGSRRFTAEQMKARIAQDEAEARRSGGKAA